MQHKGHKNRLNWRAVTSTFMLLSFLFIAISGIVLYFSPPGRIAHWTDWTFIGATKGGWQAVHTIFALSFIFIAIFHLKQNWKPLIAYMKSKGKEFSGIRKEMLISTTLGVGILLLTLSSVPPFSTIMVLGEELSQAWENSETTPPVPHAELMTLTELAQQMQLPYESIVANLKTHNIVTENADIVLAELALKYNKTPNQVYQMMTSEQNAHRGLTRGGGYGNKNIAQICETYQLTVPEAIDRLQSIGIDALKDSNIRELADRYNKRPHDIITHIIGSN